MRQTREEARAETLRRRQVREVKYGHGRSRRIGALQGRRG